MVRIVFAMMAIMVSGVPVNAGLFEDVIGEINQNYADIGDIGILHNKNSAIRGPGGDMVTYSGGLFTVWMLSQGWHATVCLPGENPNVFGSKCFVDEGINISNSLIYSYGVKDVDKDTSVSLSLHEKQKVYDSKSRRITLSLHFSVNWTRSVCENSSEEPRLNLDDGGDSDGAASSNCDVSSGDWDGWLSQTIPTPMNVKYNRNVTINITDGYNVTSEAFNSSPNGFRAYGNVSEYSPVELLKIVGSFDFGYNKSSRKNTSINASVEWFEKYYELIQSPERRIYYGELEELVFKPPFIETKSVNVFYNKSSKTTVLTIPPGATIARFDFITPFGYKKTNLTVNLQKTPQNVGQLVALFVALLFFGGLILFAVVRFVRR